MEDQAGIDGDGVWRAVGFGWSAALPLQEVVWLCMWRVELRAERWALTHSHLACIFLRRGFVASPHEVWPV
jgi:hypothetical protein